MIDSEKMAFPKDSRMKALFWTKHEGGYEEIKGKECSITLEKRPPYCDGGELDSQAFPGWKAG